MTSPKFNTLGNISISGKTEVPVTPNHILLDPLILTKTSKSLSSYWVSDDKDISNTY